MTQGMGVGVVGGVAGLSMLGLAVVSWGWGSSSVRQSLLQWQSGTPGRR